MRKYILTCLAIVAWSPMALAVPTPTPAYVVAPLEINQLEGITSSIESVTVSEGIRWSIVKDWETGTGFGYQWATSAFVAGTNVGATAIPISLSAYAPNSGYINIVQGDYLTVTFDAGTEVDIYLPPFVGNTENVLYGIGATGVLYSDRWLSQTEPNQPAVPTITPCTPTPTPVPSPSIIPPTPTPIPAQGLSGVILYATDANGNLHKVLCDTSGKLIAP